MDSVKTTKALKAIIKALDYGRFFLLTFFSIMFGFLAIVAVAQGFELFNLIAAGAAGFCSWICWTIKQD